MELIEQLTQKISEYNDNEQVAEGVFTCGVVTQLREKFPDKNVIIYHDQDSIATFGGATHYHLEFDLKLGFTKGYEIYVFDYGTFVRAGDGGNNNWRMAGNIERQDNKVKFWPVKGKEEALCVPITH